MCSVRTPADAAPRVTLPAASPPRTGRHRCGSAATAARRPPRARPASRPCQPRNQRPARGAHDPRGQPSPPSPPTPGRRPAHDSSNMPEKTLTSSALSTPLSPSGARAERAGARRSDTDPCAPDIGHDRACSFTPAARRPRLARRPGVHPGPRVGREAESQDMPEETCDARRPGARRPARSARDADHSTASSSIRIGASYLAWSWGRIEAWPCVHPTRTPTGNPETNPWCSRPPTRVG